MDRVMETHRYEIEPEGVSRTTRVPCVLVPQCDIRPLDWAITHLCLPKTNTKDMLTCLPISGASPLLPLSCVGIDTCSALSVSTERRDFTFIDESLAARESVSLRGIGGEQSTIGGRGPMLISVLDDKGIKYSWLTWQEFTLTKLSHCSSGF